MPFIGSHNQASQFGVHEFPTLSVQHWAVFNVDLSSMALERKRLVFEVLT